MIIALKRMNEIEEGEKTKPFKYTKPISRVRVGRGPFTKNSKSHEGGQGLF